jgi:hypothetical protein
VLFIGLVSNIPSRSCGLNESQIGFRKLELEYVSYRIEWFMMSVCRMLGYIAIIYSRREKYNIGESIVVVII